MYFLFKRDYTYLYFAYVDSLILLYLKAEITNFGT